MLHTHNHVCCNVKTIFYHDRRRPAAADVLFLVLLISVFVSGEVSGFEPDFLYPLENVTVAQGRDATFTCVVNNLGGYRVSGELATARVCIIKIL